MTGTINESIYLAVKSAAVNPLVGLPVAEIWLNGQSNLHILVYIVIIKTPVNPPIIDATSLSFACATDFPLSVWTEYAVAIQAKKGVYISVASKILLSKLL